MSNEEKSVGGDEHLTVVPVTVPKELNDVRVALNSVVADIKAGKSITEIAAGNFPKLVDAVQGIDKVGEEVKVHIKESIVCGGLLGGEIISALVA